MAFEDTIKSGLLDRIKLDEVTAEVAPELETPDSVVPAKKSSLEEEDDILMEDFVHPLLERFSVAKDDKPLEPGMLPVKLGSSREGGTVKMLGSALEASPAECHQANSLPDLLAALSQAYRAVLEAFLQDGKYTALRLVPLPVAAKIGAPLKRALMPQPLWSAVALALAQLNAKQQAKLEDLKVELFAPGAAAEALRDTLKSKSSMATNDFTVDNKRGRIPLRKEGYSWCRRDNDQDARLYRLEAFMHTQRAVYAKSFSVESKEINLDTEKMLSGTRVFIGGSAGTNTNGEEDPETPIPFRLTRVEELFKESPKPKGETVMEVAAFMVAKGAKVVAVNAASAYQVGGGSTTGGRHALEEAWCISSTLYQSLASVEPIKGGFPGYRQHVPVMGCIISPAVQVFRECTDDGYGFVDVPTELPGVVSVAMFNRNHRVRDSPLDSPEQPTEYLHQTRGKLEAAILAAVQVLEAEVIVVPDVGCGVFGNDPLVIGGCLGSVLRRYASSLTTVKQVIITGRRDDFADSCERALKGEDPRPKCQQGLECDCLSDTIHAARFNHGSPEGKESIVDEALLMLAKHPQPDSKTKPPCRYGATCHLRTAEHLARFSHPEKGGAVPVPRAGGTGGPSGTSTGGSSGTGRTSGGGITSPGRTGGTLPKPGGTTRPWSATPHKDPTTDPSVSRITEEPKIPRDNPVVESGGSSPSKRPVCKYGKACYNTNPKHLEDYAHPWIEGETEEQEKDRMDLQECHDLLTLAKDMRWADVERVLKRHPRLVDMRPDGRKFALIHFAAHQFHLKALEIVLHAGADTNTKSQDGHTAKQILQANIQALEKPKPGERRDEAVKRLEHKNMAENCLLRLARHDGGTHRGAGGAPRAAGAGGASTHRSVGGGAPPPATERPRVAAESGGGGGGGEEPVKGTDGSNTYIVVKYCPNRDLNGQYLKQPEEANGKEIFRQVTASEEGHYKIFYHQNAKIGWSIGLDPTTTQDPTAYLGPSLAKDPCSRSYAQSWNVVVKPLFSGCAPYWFKSAAMSLDKVIHRTVRP